MRRQFVTEHVIIHIKLPLTWPPVAAGVTQRRLHLPFQQTNEKLGSVPVFQME